MLEVVVVAVVVVVYKVVNSCSVTFQTLIKPQILYIKNCDQFIKCISADLKRQKLKSISTNIMH